MNQILIINKSKKRINNRLSNSEKNTLLRLHYSTNSKKTNAKSSFRFQLFFFFSLIFFFIIIMITSSYFYSLLRKEKLSNNLINTYNISRLYSKNSSNNLTPIDNNIFGIIKIPKINISYPIFSTIDEELLKISPCKFYGETLSSFGNICIAGHNYNNSLFFSNINLLEYGDGIKIFDNQGNLYLYNVFSSYEVYENDLSPITNYSKDKKIITLVTCNNFNKKRIIIKAEQQDF